MPRCFRFQLRSIFILMFVFACMLTYVTHAINKGHRQIDAVMVLLRETQADFAYENQFASDGTYVTKWLRPGPPQTVWQNYQSEVVAISLKLRRSQVSDDKFYAIVNAINCFPNLKFIHFDCGGEFCPELFSIAVSHDLRGLSLENMKLTDLHVLQIAKLRNLERLNISENNITGSSLALLSGMHRLEILYLTNNNIADESVLELSKSDSLVHVELSGNPIQQSVISVLQAKRPNLTIVMRYD